MSQSSLNSPENHGQHNSKQSLMLQVKGSENIRFRMSERVETPPASQRALSSLDEIYVDKLKTSSQNKKQSVLKSQLNNSMNIARRSF